VIQREQEEALARGPGFSERRQERSEDHNRWHVRAGQFAALALARHVFGPDASVEVLPWPGRRAVAGGLMVRVPFQDLTDHRAKEALFLSLAALDPVLGTTAFLYLMHPEPLLMGSAS